MWEGRHVLVTGGASFIGSHLVDALVGRRARVRIVDDLSSGTQANIQNHVDRGTVEFIAADLREPGITRQAMQGIDLVFHLAADHGGRGYVDLKQAGPAGNLYLDGLVFFEAVKAGVPKVVFASSGCVYPNHLQTNPQAEVFLTESLVTPPYDADNLYGWAKLMGELTLRAYVRERGLQAASLRYFAVYGPRAKENHSVMAMLARALTRQDPFEIWGTGEQVRNWTFVDDIITGTLLAAERVDDATAINLGTMERITVRGAAEEVCRLMGYRPRFVTRPDLPMGPANRVADNKLARQLLDWQPQVSFQAGLVRTTQWYVRNRQRSDAQAMLDNRGLFERQVQLHQMAGAGGRASARVCLQPSANTSEHLRRGGCDHGAAGQHGG